MSDKIKILQMIARLNVGGTALHVLTLTRTFNNDKYDTLLLHGNVESNEEDMTKYEGMNVSQKEILPELGRSIRPLKDIVTLMKVIKVIRRERPDIVHTHTAKAGAVGRSAAAICRVPVIVHTYHGHVFSGYFSPLMSNVFRMIDKFLARRSTRIITISKLQKEELSGLLGLKEGRVEVIPLGFGVEKFATCRECRAGEFRKLIGVPDEAKIVSIIGRITGIKNHTLFLEAAKLIAEKNDDAVFVIVGDGEDREKCERMAKEFAIEKRVIFTGWQEDIEKVYADTAVTVLTSINEGTPMCVIESLAAGVPVVATKVGGVADIFDDGEGGFIVEPGDAKAVAEAVLKLLYDETLCRKIGTAGQNRMIETYKEERMLNDMESLYEKLLDESKKR